ncbi:hypothetical protein FAZ15_01130 [Sphingobacterium olei]|uniref:DUF5000 domain-containing protein n=1 Tax=Sphingobacterium olei TaxID=2571155 RepID=A0A4U0P664_9SPHI|nr:DUF4998 domain-containing protein [Sphingobacterium olei]TJZ62936.1 hypothetical protein FAZ15_01130 [Sphingobacterium olei]
MLGILKIASSAVLTAILILTQSCQKQDHGYKQFLEGGEKVYVAKADSLQAFPGKNRVRLQWLLLSDPTVEGARVYWNNGADSTMVSFQKTDDIDTINVDVNDLAEGGYNFEVITFDGKGNSSIKTTVFGYAYGEQYSSSLVARSLTKATYVDDGDLVFEWRRPNEAILGTVLRYTDIAGNTKMRILPSDKDTLMVNDWMQETPAEYYTWYKPDAVAVDSFQSVSKVLNLQLEFNGDNKVDPTTFSHYPLPGDAPHWTGAGNAFTNLWSGVIAGGAPARAWYRTANGSGMPHHFQLDLGKQVSLSQLRLWQRGAITEHNLLYANGNLRHFEVWGSNDPADDGSYAGWIRLNTCEVVKPSGQNVGVNDPIDIQHAEAGHLFTFEQRTPKVRYIRIKAVENWAKTDFMFTSELQFWEWGTRLIY